MTNELEEFKNLLSYVLGHYGISQERQQAIFDAYTESWRGYHNYRHILNMWKRLCVLPHFSEEGEARFILGLMIIYHDVWLKVKRDSGESERRSAAWAVADLKSASAAPAITSCVEQGILATISHGLNCVERSNYLLVSILLDLDLYGIGQHMPEFKLDTEAIWIEYQSVYTREEYDDGRSKWAGTFLKRDALYHTEYFAHLEGQARSNLESLAAG